MKNIEFQAENKLNVQKCCQQVQSENLQDQSSNNSHGRRQTFHRVQNQSPVHYQHQVRYQNKVHNQNHAHNQNLNLKYEHLNCESQNVIFETQISGRNGHNFTYETRTLDHDSQFLSHETINDANEETHQEVSNYQSVKTRNVPVSNIPKIHATWNSKPFRYETPTNVRYQYFENSTTKKECIEEPIDLTCSPKLKKTEKVLNSLQEVKLYLKIL